VPWAVILGEDEQAQGKVKIKEMGLPEGHPEKDGVLVDMKDLVSEVQKRLDGGVQSSLSSSSSAAKNVTGVAGTEPAKDVVDSVKFAVGRVGSAMQSLLGTGAVQGVAAKEEARGEEGEQQQKKGGNDGV
jgi:hypothetical protein